MDTEFKFTSLYLHHNGSGKNPTQSDIIAPNKTTGWGSTAVNNWPIYDRAGPDAKLVARAQGLHIYAGSWHNTFTLLFEIERYKKSTLQVTGVDVSQGEWSIVGGTGELAMARGVIKKKSHDTTDGVERIELAVHGFCSSRGGAGRPVVIFPEEPIKSSLWGGSGGSAVESEKPAKITSIIVRSTKASIDSFEYSYNDRNGNKFTAGPWGTGQIILAEIKLAPDEILTEVSGIVTTGYVFTLKFVTNKGDYGPFGNEPSGGGTPFKANAPPGKQIVGFFGRTDNKYLNAIGVYID